LAGATASGNLDATGTFARFYSPSGITTDGTNLYCVEKNNQIRKIVIATGVVTTLAGSSTAGSADGIGAAAQFKNPVGIAFLAGNLYVADGDNNMIRKVVIATGEVSTFAGATTSGSTDGTGTAARFLWPNGITTDGTNLYVVEYGNNQIRKIEVATRVVTSLAGSTTAGSADGIGPAAQFNAPIGITTDRTNLYVAEYGNRLIRKVIIATGEVTTLAGSGTIGSLDGTGTAAQFSAPEGITTDGTNLYVADANNHKIRKIVIATGVVSTIAGTTTAGNVNGTGTAAQFNTPIGITTDGNRLYITEHFNNDIRCLQ
jgi:uncharacterized alkaline shock family protein YloU